MVQGFLYFRCVGDHPSRFLSGGDASNSYKFNNREEQDFGYDNMRVMIELPDEGIVYCRGVGDNHTNPEMACVLFDSEGNVRDRYAYLGKLGRWNDIVHLLLIAARVSRLVTGRPIVLRSQQFVPSLGRVLGGALAQQVFVRGITTPSLPNFSSSAVAEHVANLPDRTEAFDSIVHKSPHEDIEIPDQTIWEVAAHQARVNGDKPAFVCGLTHRTVTFRELFTGARRLAASFAQEGIRKGNVVVLHSFNCIEYPMVVLALTGMGAVCSPASPLFVPNELAYQLTQSKASYLVTHKQLENVAVEAASMAGLTNSVTFTMGSTEETETHDLKSINDMAAQTEHDFFYERIDPNLKLMLPFSSGTTGNPKGVGLSAKNLLANALQVSHVEPDGENFLGLVPFFHIYGMMLIHLSILQSKSIVILPRFMPDTFLDALSTYKIRTAHIAPPAVLFLAHHPLVEEFDLSSTEFVVSGGAPIGKQVESLVHERLGLNVKQIYGMTELSPAVNYGEDHTRKPGSAGRLVPNTELRVRCMNTDRDLPPNQEGELMYRGPQVMLGYENNHEANQNIFTEDGFLRTGDIGYIDDDGFVFVIDRAKELIKYKGHQVAPGELEDVLNHHPAIADCCCVRGQNAQSEEIPKAFVVLQQPDSPNRPTPQDIVDYVAKHVAPFKKVREVQFIDAIPKNASGKMLRRQLQERENRFTSPKGRNGGVGKLQEAPYHAKPKVLHLATLANLSFPFQQVAKLAANSYIEQREAFAFLVPKAMIKRRRKWRQQEREKAVRNVFEAQMHMRMRRQSVKHAEIREAQEVEADCVTLDLDSARSRESYDQQAVGKANDVRDAQWVPHSIEEELSSPSSSEGSRKDSPPKGMDSARPDNDLVLKVRQPLTQDAKFRLEKLGRLDMSLAVPAFVYRVFLAVATVGWGTSLNDDRFHVDNALGRRRGRASVTTTSATAATGRQGSAKTAVQVSTTVSAAQATTVTAWATATSVVGPIVATAGDAHRTSVCPVFGWRFEGGLGNEIRSHSSETWLKSRKLSACRVPVSSGQIARLALDAATQGHVRMTLLPAASTDQFTQQWPHSASAGEACSLPVSGLTTARSPLHLHSIVVAAVVVRVTVVRGPVLDYHGVHVDDAVGRRSVAVVVMSASIVPSTAAA
ncbi:hypothetical protein PC119_g12930 [Phytophthora cactorum]|nr:hypothetical protein PC119_g12930 [Phytophthora cactorum]